MGNTCTKTGKDDPHGDDYVTGSHQPHRHQHCMSLPVTTTTTSATHSVTDDLTTRASHSPSPRRECSAESAQDNLKMIDKTGDTHNKATLNHVERNPQQLQQRSTPRHQGPVNPLMFRTILSKDCARPVVGTTASPPCDALMFQRGSVPPPTASLMNITPKEALLAPRRRSNGSDATAKLNIDVAPLSNATMHVESPPTPASLPPPPLSATSRPTAQSKTSPEAGGTLWATDSPMARHHHIIPGSAAVATSIPAAFRAVEGALGVETTMALVTARNNCNSFFNKGDATDDVGDGEASTNPLAIKTKNLGAVGSSSPSSRRGSTSIVLPLQAGLIDWQEGDPPLVMSKQPSSCITRVTSSSVASGGSYPLLFRQNGAIPQDAFGSRASSIVTCSSSSTLTSTSTTCTTTTTTSATVSSSRLGGFRGRSLKVNERVDK